MKHQPFTITINDYQRASQIKDDVQIGHYFVFAKYQKAIGDGRLKRLLVEKEAINKALPLVDEPVELDGVTITPEQRTIEPIGCVVSDRDLYRAEQDTVHLFIAFPTEPENDLHLNIDCNGAFFTKRDVQLSDDNVSLETLSNLLPGSYEAQLSIAEQRIGIPVSFTVAEYTLAPLSARLINHSLNRNKDILTFELAVESYQIPFEDQLTVQLMEQGREVSSCTLNPLSPGCYTGSLKMKMEIGPFRLRLIATSDAERVAEVAIPGSRKVEREVTIISELGKEQCFSMMPEQSALPLRGGYLTEGDFLAAPLTVEKIVTKQRLIQVNADMESVGLVILDLTTGEYQVQKVGNVTAGNTITVNNDVPMATVFVGGFVNGQPFEGYTTFIAPSQFQLSIDVPRTIRPRTDLVVRLTCFAPNLQGLPNLEGFNKTIPVLLCVRDERLTATDKPSVSLGAAAKRGIEAAIKDMAEGTFTPLSELEEMNARGGAMAKGLFASTDYMFDGMLSQTRGYGGELRSFSPPVTMGLLGDSVEAGFSKGASLLGGATRSMTSAKPAARRSSQVETKRADVGEFVDKAAISKPLRADFPEVLFYDIVPVSGTKEVVIPLSDSLATFTVETFAMANGDWTQNQAPVVVDQPVRVDLELPLAVHPDDKVNGRLYAFTSSNRARMTLMCDGKIVALQNGTPIEALNIETPFELEFYVKSGTYRATVEDSSTGETDSIEVAIGEPGKFKSYAKELGLLVKDESINLETVNALSLRVLPTIDTSFDALITATADYAHLCCEQTAAKILAATFMYLTAKNAEQRHTAEQIILTGIAREQKMIRSGQGFTMYPNQDYISTHYSTLAVRYLWKLNQLDDMPDISSNLRKAVREGLSLADQAAEAHHMQRMPEQIQSIEDAYTLATAGKETVAVRQFIENTINFSDMIVKSKQPAVANRKTLAYAAASLIALND
ncbi:MAG TPA: hypothetical protein ENI48_04265, partial [Thioploca sp.]|nr:hypothetical protein [Thioploca sp.]